MRHAESPRYPLRLTPAGRNEEGACPPGAADEAELVRRAREDATAFGMLYRQHYDAIAAHIGRRTGDWQATEDLISEVFRTALEKIGRYRPRGVPFRFWLLRIATLVVKRHWRRVRKRAECFEELPAAEEAPASREPQTSIDAEALRLALARLPDRLQAAISLVHLDGLSVDEAAQVLGCRPGTVKSRLSRGRSELRRLLSGGSNV